jgi:hypothetical protein
MPDLALGGVSVDYFSENSIGTMSARVGPASDEGMGGKGEARAIIAVASSSSERTPG